MEYGRTAHNETVEKVYSREFSGFFTKTQVL
jgi:hypothetical protein